MDSCMPRLRRQHERNITSTTWRVRLRTQATARYASLQFQIRSDVGLKFWMSCGSTKDGTWAGHDDFWFVFDESKWGIEGDMSVYRYSECGLDNVLIEGMNTVFDDDDEKSVTIPNVD